MGPLIVEHEGTLEHFAGDGFMTFFNDPVAAARPRDAGRRPGGRDARPTSRRCPTTGGDAATSSRSGIGIATGYATLGRIGFEGRYDYGAVGQRHHPRRPPQRRGGARRDPHRQRHVRRGRGARSRASRRATGSSRASAGRCRRTRSAAWPSDGGQRMSAPTPRSERRSRTCSRSPAATLEFVDELVDTYLDDAAAQVAALRAAAAAGRCCRAGPAGPHRSSRAARTSGRRPSPTLPGARGGCRAGRAGLAARVAAVETAFAGVREALLAERAAR